MRFALVKQVRERALDAPQVRDAASRVLEPSGGDTPDAAPISSVLELEQGDDLLQAEAEGLGAFDKANPVYMVHPVAAIGAHCASGLWHQPAALVIAYRFHPDARGFGDIADCEVHLIRHKHPLDSVPKYGLYTAATILSMVGRAK